MRKVIILISIIIICAIMYKHNHYNGYPYNVVDRFSIEYGDNVSIWLEGHYIVFKDGKPILEGNESKEMFLNQQGNYKIIELKVD